MRSLSHALLALLLLAFGADAALAQFEGLPIGFPGSPGDPTSLDVRYIRLALRDDPATTMVVGWTEPGAGATSTTEVCFGKTEDVGELPNADGAVLAENCVGADRVAQPLQWAGTAPTLQNGFARLTGLEPNTDYSFVVVQGTGQPSDVRKFRTGPTSLDTPFSIVAGGDSRTNREPRQNANRTVSLVRPLAVMFGGDYTDFDTQFEWLGWMEDWQLTKSEDGRMYPIIGARGNHEYVGDQSVTDMFDTPTNNGAAYYAIPLAGNEVRIYTLNTLISVMGDQTDWFAQDLKDNTQNTQWKLAHYHYPIWPHEAGKDEQIEQYEAWADLFYDNRFGVVVECDAHVSKRTFPVKPTGDSSSPDVAYERDDQLGTTFIGEGCWGAPTRDGSDIKPWTRAASADSSFNQINWIQISREKIDLRTIKVDFVDQFASVQDSAPFAVPEGFVFWRPDGTREGLVTITPRVEEAVPVEFTSFSVQPSGKTVLLSWATASETNNAGFEIQRKVGSSFKKVAFKKGKGTTSAPQRYSFRVGDLDAGPQTFRLKQVDFDGQFEYTSEVEVVVGLQGGFALSQAYPNPFTKAKPAVFSLTVERDQNVKVVVYNALGQTVRTLYDGTLKAGRPAPFEVKANGLASGIYFVRAEGDSFNTSQKLTLVK